MAWIDGYEVVAPGDVPPGAAPGTEKTNESQSSTGPAWTRERAKGARPGNPTGTDSDSATESGGKY